MPSPFPGMDPFIEACGLWGDFHDKLIGEIEREVSRQLPARYVARMGERTYVEWIDPRDLESMTRPFEPDVSIRGRDWAKGDRSGGAAVVEADPQAVVMHGLIEIEHHEIFLEIRELDPQRRLVTCIEVLSPSNKRFGTVGWLQYDRKRQVFLEGHANLVEIDLLRGGRRRGMEEPWPDSPYYVLAMRKAAAPACQVWPARIDRPLPECAIPLVPPDADLGLPLQSLVDAIYARSRYEVDIDYARPLDLPLRPEETALLPTDS
jgi:hypothetical protein